MLEWFPVAHREQTLTHTWSPKCSFKFNFLTTASLDSSLEPLYAKLFLLCCPALCLDGRDFINVSPCWVFPYLGSVLMSPFLKVFSVSSNAALVPTEATAFSFRLLDYCVDLSSEGLWILHTLRERIASTHLESPGNSLSALHINRWLINQLDSDIISLVSRLQLSGSREY